MKMFLTAVALTIASPALAQSAPQADPHSGHASHKSADPAAHSGHKPGHSDHKGCCDKSPDGRMECCEKMAAEGKKMACCEKHGKAGSADPHAGHNKAK